MHDFELLCTQTWIWLEYSFRALTCLLKVTFEVFRLLEAIDLLSLFWWLLYEKVENTNVVSSLLLGESIEVSFETVLALWDEAKGNFFMIGKREPNFLFILARVRNGMNRSGSQVGFGFDWWFHFN